MAIDLAEQIRKQYEVFNAHDPVKLAEIVHPEGSITIVPFGLTLKGKSGYQEFGKLWFTAFPDVNVRVKNVFASGEWVVTEFESTGTHKGTLRTPMGDIAPTGKFGRVLGAEVLRIRDGKLYESRMYLDAYGMLAQLGILPAKLAGARPAIEERPETPLI